MSLIPRQMRHGQIELHTSRLDPTLGDRDRDTCSNDRGNLPSRPIPLLGAKPGVEAFECLAGTDVDRHLARAALFIRAVPMARHVQRHRATGAKVRPEERSRLRHGVSTIHP